MTLRQLLKKAIPLWAAFAFIGVFLLQASDVVHKEGWAVAAERFALIVVVAYPMSVAIIYRLSVAMKWGRTL